MPARLRPRGIASRRHATILPMANARASIVAGSVGLVCLALGWGCGDSSPTGPTRNGVTSLTVACTPAATGPLRCRATVVCADGPCSASVPNDVTTDAVWTADDSTVLRVAAPGQLEGAGVGDTVTRASWRGVSGQQTVSVFTVPQALPTTEIAGTVFESGKTATTGAIDGARVEFIGGLLAGKNATTGTPPTVVPGFNATTVGPGGFRILGVPPGGYRLRVSRTGYVTQERDVTVQAGGPAITFQLVPQ